MTASGQNESSESRNDVAQTSRSLLERVKHRDDRAWNELVELYAPLVYFWCRRSNIVEQDIPDVVQDVFRAVVKGIGTFRKERRSDTFRGWLRTVTRSKLTDYFRRLHRNPAAAGGTSANLRIEQIADVVEDEEPECGASMVEEQLAEQALFRRGLERIRMEFDPKTWQAFWSVVVDGRSATEVGEDLSMRPGTVRVAKSRVLQRLRRELGDVD